MTKSTTPTSAFNDLGFAGTVEEGKTEIQELEEKLKAFMPVLDKMVLQGLVVLSDVDVIKYSHNQEKSDRRRLRCILKAGLIVS